MSFKPNLDSLLTVFVLIFTSYVILATSSFDPDLPLEGSYFISSECVDPVVEGQEIEVMDGEVTSPSGTTFLDFGFPDTQISLGSGAQGSVGSIQRSCKLTFGENDTQQEAPWIFGCYDNDAFSCSIILER